MALATVRVESRSKSRFGLDVLGAGIDARLKNFQRDEEKARRDAALLATQATRAAWTGRRHRREVIPRRAGRSSTGGQLEKHLQWSAKADGVEFDTLTARRNAPHWIIQEIGTGNSAVMRSGGQTLPRGRPRKGASYVAHVPSQRGRRISAGLVFASGGKYSAPGTRRDQQLHFASRVSGVPARRSDGSVVAGIVINREIRPTRMVRQGGTTAFRQYEISLQAAARRHFSKK